MDCEGDLYGDFLTGVEMGFMHGRDLATKRKRISVVKASALCAAKPSIAGMVCHNWVTSA